MNVTRKDIVIDHHGRSMQATLFSPERATGLPVLFAHGFNGAASDFFHAARLCAEHGSHALCVNFCGGSVRDMREGSKFPTEEMTLLTEQEDVLAALDVLLAESNMARAVLFGGSQGGLVCALAAEQVKERVAGLALLFPAFSIPDDWRRAFPDEVPARHTLWDMTLGRGYFTCAKGLDPYAMVGGVTAPVLVMHGTQDTVVSLAVGRRVAERYPHAKFLVFEHEGHGFSPAGTARMEQELLSLLKEVGTGTPNA